MVSWSCLAWRAWEGVSTQVATPRLLVSGVHRRVCLVLNDTGWPLSGRPDGGQRRGDGDRLVRAGAGARGQRGRGPGDGLGERAGGGGVAGVAGVGGGDRVAAGGRAVVVQVAW